MALAQLKNSDEVNGAANERGALSAGELNAAAELRSECHRPERPEPVRRPPAPALALCSRRARVCSRRSRAMLRVVVQIPNEQMNRFVKRNKIK